MSYSIKHSHGRTETHETYEEAVAALVLVYGTPEIGHPGDISEGGETTLVWGSAELAQDDDGSRACAKIQVRHADWSDCAESEQFRAIGEVML